MLLRQPRRLKLSLPAFFNLFSAPFDEFFDSRELEIIRACLSIRREDIRPVCEERRNLYAKAHVEFDKDRMIRLWRQAYENGLALRNGFDGLVSTI